MLRYSVQSHCTWPNPLEDYEQAMELLKEKAEKWKIYPEKTAVLGFSAGGHLAAAAATMAKNRPAAAILGYAVTGTDVKGCSLTAPDTISQVDELTPPCFLFHTRNDNVVPVMNSIRFMEALAEHDISFESHIYSYGPHGFSTCDTSVQGPSTHISRRVPDWVADSIGWLREVLGEFDDENGGLRSPQVKPHISGDQEPFLSVDCTMGRIQGNPKGAELLKSFMAQEKGAVSGHFQARFGEIPPEMEETVKRMILRDALGFVQAGAEVVEALDAQLKQIPNN